MASQRARVREEASGRRPVASSLPFVKDASGALVGGQLNGRMNDLFKSHVFSDYELHRRVPKNVAAALRGHVSAGTVIDRATADVVAQAMKEWALQIGCTHYTHWFQPLRGLTAEKHDSFVDFHGQERDLHFEFSGDMLLRGEPDASSFPGGGLRATHEARGYTLWDPTSPAFVMEGTSGNTLYIPTLFLSWTGEALDVKTPLKRANLAISRAATDLLHLNGDTDVASVWCSMGPEQEFFVIDRAFFYARPDLVACAKTVLGALPPRTQQLEDHYFATIPERVLAFIQDVEIDLWRLGIPTKTRHNEVAPGQFEMAPIFEECNLAADHNLILMEVLKRKAVRHNLVVLLHEKPFKGVNGSGKHNNWSMCTNTGINLLNPTSTPADNRRFQLFLAACIKGVDMHGDLLRCAVAYSGNDYRLGAQEAPPAIMSIYLGEHLEHLVDDLIDAYDKAHPAPPAPTTSAPAPPLRSPRPGLVSQSSVLSLGQGIGAFHRDRTDRNRTSPYAFTGNKFEFRAPGSSSEVGASCTILNLIVAAAITDMIEDVKAERAALALATPAVADIEGQAIVNVIGKTLKAHRRVVFGGDGYSSDWVAEAARRGLPNLKDTVEALKEFGNAKNRALWTKFEVLSTAEVDSRTNIQFHAWTQQVLVEAASLHAIAQQHVVPAAYKQQQQLATSILAAQQVLAPLLASNSEKKDSVLGPQQAALLELTRLLDHLLEENRRLGDAIAHAKKEDKAHGDSPRDVALLVRDTIRPLVVSVRSTADHLEALVDDSLWTLPKYEEILFTV